MARSGVIDEYRALLVQTIERNWMRPPSARAGLQCTLYVTPGAGRDRGGREARRLQR